MLYLYSLNNLCLLNDQLANRERNYGSMDVLKSNRPLLIPFLADDDDDMRNPSSIFFSPW